MTTAAPSLSHPFTGHHTHGIDIESQQRTGSSASCSVSSLCGGVQRYWKTIFPLTTSAAGVTMVAIGVLASSPLTWGVGAVAAVGGGLSTIVICCLTPKKELAEEIDDLEKAVDTLHLQEGKADQLIQAITQTGTQLQVMASEAARHSDQLDKEIESKEHAIDISAAHLAEAASKLLQVQEVIEHMTGSTGSLSQEAAHLKHESHEISLEMAHMHADITRLTRVVKPIIAAGEKVHIETAAFVHATDTLIAVTTQFSTRIEKILQEMAQQKSSIAHLQTRLQQAQEMEPQVVSLTQQLQLVNSKCGALEAQLKIAVDQLSEFDTVAELIPLMQAHLPEIRKILGIP